MVKEPHPGRVKTRLASGIGAIPAAWWFRHSAANLIRQMRDPRWQMIIAVTPNKEGMLSRVWPGDLPRLAQGQGGLGERMARLLANARRGPVVVVGADIPGISKNHITQAFRALGAHEMVFGPALDGGFWLVGAKQGFVGPPGLFQDVNWSTESTLRDTITGLPGTRIAMIETLSDVDTVADL